MGAMAGLAAPPSAFLSSKFIWNQVSLPCIITPVSFPFFGRSPQTPEPTNMGDAGHLAPVPGASPESASLSAVRATRGLALSRQRRVGLRPVGPVGSREGPAPQACERHAVTKDLSVVMSSEKCFVMFSQSTECPAHSSGAQLSLSQTGAPGKRAMLMSYRQARVSKARFLSWSSAQRSHSAPSDGRAVPSNSFVDKC